MTKSDGHARNYRKPAAPTDNMSYTVVTDQTGADTVDPFENPKKVKPHPNTKRHGMVSISPVGSQEQEQLFGNAPPHAKKLAKLAGWMPHMDTVRASVPKGQLNPANKYKQMSARQLVGETTANAIISKNNLQQRLSELTAKTYKKTPLPNIFYFNPYQDYDYIVLQDMYMNSIAGRIVDLFVSFMFGKKGITPILKLREPTGKPADNELIEKHHAIIDRLLAYDKSLHRRNNRLTYSVQTKFKSLVKRSMIFGRAMIAFDRVYNDPKVPFFEDNQALHNTLKPIHTRDMGLIRQDTESWDLTGVTIRWFSEVFEPDNMLYLEHEPDSPIFRGGFYGMSFMQSMIGSSRTLRTLIDRVMPQYAKTNWASRALVIFKKKGTAEDNPNEELDEIAPMFATGEIALGIEDEPHDDVAVHNLDVSPDMDHLVKAIEFHVKYIMAQAGVPQALLYDEGSINLATLIGKMREFADQVHTKQLWASEQIAMQWYQPNFEKLYDDDSEERKIFEIDAEFDKIKVDSWQDSVKAVRHLRAILGLKDTAIGELIGIDNIEEKIDTSKPVIDAGGSTNVLSTNTDTQDSDSSI